MPISSTQHQALSHLLSTELESARVLLRTLEQEFAALSRGDAESIAEATAEKQRQTLRMGQHLQMRDRFLSDNACSGGQQGTDALIAQLPVDAGAAILWRDLQQVALQLRDKNEINGGIIAHGQRHLRQAVAILSGQSVNGDTYGPQGNRCAGQPSQAFAKA